TTSNSSADTYSASWTPAEVGNVLITVTATDNDGLISTASRTVIVYLTNPPPLASFIVTPDYGAPPLAVTLDASSSFDINDDVLSYSWDLGDGNFASGITAEHTFQEEGNYIVTLTVDDGDGGVSSISSPVTVVAPNCDLVLYYKTPDNNMASAMDNQVRPHFLLANEGGNSVSLQDVTIRYWYTREGMVAQNAWVDYAVVGSENVTTDFVELTTPASGVDHYLEVGFTEGAGAIAPGDESGEIQARFAKVEWSNYDETDDYSYRMDYASFTPWEKVTVYCGGLLAWGEEPEGAGGGTTSASDPSSTNMAGRLDIWPNPASNLATISYLLPSSGFTDLSVVDPMGRVVKTLVPSVEAARAHTIELPTGDLAEGMYYVQLVGRDFQVVKPLVVVR
ncbi:MAG: cellulose binding domain-containing protein, partial [Bacteroidota bacterium]